jgi:hypothetical protein
LHLDCPRGGKKSRKSRFFFRESITCR